ncbi:hypothetical protein MNBD_BACTEROID01-440 [hydrothermal vent metagenome]|uniref:Pyrrolo-quinoline quinone repeat domain-containing protein n=1 Tax=hydrothermal vent metagenome TaxID=652676 RepID=A0A3B0TTQ4_9ZZZZ
MDKRGKLQFSQTIVITAGAFCIVVAMLLSLNFWQVSRNEPLESKALEALVERLSQEPQNDALKQEMRNLDLLARKAYFNSQWQVKTGAYLLLFGAIVFAIALRYYYSVKARIEELGQQVENETVARLMSQKWIIIAGAGVLILALAASYMTVDYLKVYSSESVSAEASGEAQPEEIEVIEVGRGDSGQLAENKESVSQESPAEEARPTTDVALKGGEVVIANKTKGGVEEKSPVQKSKTVDFPGPGQIKANHSGFRGPFGNGVSFMKNIPVDWDGATGRNMLWKAETPRQGYNSPVIWGDKAFLTGSDAQIREVYCFDKNSGKMLWSKPVDNIPGSPAKPPKVTDDTGLSAPTLTTDGQRVYAIFATGDIISFDMDGNRVWARNLGVPDNHYGHSSSLICWKDKVFVQYDTNKGGKVLALNTLSGKTVWETRRSSKISWASPVLAEISGKMQLVLSADPIVAGYDIDNGKELWAVDCMMGEVGPSPAFGGGLVYAANEYARLAAINPVDGSIKWEEDEYMPEVASPVVANGLLFIATSYGVFVCYDAVTGDKLWEEEYNAGFYASPVIADNKVFALDTDGVMHILELSREAKVVGEPLLGEEGYATPAFSDGRIYIRGKEYLYCFGE